MKLVELIFREFLATLYMTLLSTAIAYAVGLPAGIILVLTDKRGIKPLRIVNGVLGIVVNFFRSVPFLLLMIALMRFTRFIVGTSIGPTATIVPLVVGAAPFIARLVEASIKEVDPGVIEAAQSMGASSWQIVTKVMLPEAKPSLLIGSAVATITILGYSAMAGIVGGGGLGDVAVKYGYYRWETGTMWIIILILVIIVQILQEVGMFIAKKTDKRK